MEFFFACTGSRKSSGQIVRDTGSVKDVGFIILRPSMYSPCRKVDGLRVRFHGVAAAESRRDLLDSPTWSILSTPLSPKSRNGSAASESVSLFEKECMIGHSLTTAATCSSWIGPVDDYRGRNRLYICQAVLLSFACSRLVICSKSKGNNCFESVEDSQFWQ
ncbi:hypothetical protein Y032_0004g2110 [Ancylostoma ceylanicum]|uniref:Uncharacterized protein n=1 Tax=Ancylostoma ceylanicum TaxID=53326 RepID=A0A016VX50_9BILA|nr:hypothetical protein Y032_0004g2110 [Ancylostoma ceylanicum]